MYFLSLTSADCWIKKSRHVFFSSQISSAYTRREHHCMFLFSDKIIALIDSWAIHPYTSLFSDNIPVYFVPWQHPNIFLFFDNVPLFLFSNNIPAYFFSFFGHWFCILLFSDKILNIPQTKSLDIYRRIFCIIRQYNCKPFVGQHPCIFFLKLCSSLYWTIWHVYIFFYRLTLSLHICYSLTTSLQI